MPRPLIAGRGLVRLREPERAHRRPSLFTGTSDRLGEFQSGLVAALVGPVLAVIGGIGAITVAAVWMPLFPELRRIRAYEE